MIKIISPEQFKTIPWKNGLGQTTELAINPGGTVHDFDWRLSIASVVEDGLFSDFSGCDRELILLQGNGIKLSHDDEQVDELTKPLSIAIFDGASRTIGTLINGPIKDFNVMTRQRYFKAEVRTYTQRQTIVSSLADLNFIYATEQSIDIQLNQENIELPKGHLLQISDEAVEHFQVSGSGFILILLQPLF